MTIDDLKSNIEKTNKIITYAIKTNLNRDYNVQVNKLDWDYSVDSNKNVSLYSILVLPHL